jgi:hypothetical protein
MAVTAWDCAIYLLVVTPNASVFSAVSEFSFGYTFDSHKRGSTANIESHV